MEFQIKQIAEILGGKIQGDPSAKVNQLAKIQEANQGALCFLANSNYEKYLYSTNATAVLISKKFVPQQPIKTNLIIVDDAYKAFAHLVEIIHNFTCKSKQGIEQMAFISKQAQIGKDVYVGSFAYISDNSKISDNVKIYPQVFVGEKVEIGEGTILYSGVKIYDGCKIGKNCIIHAGTVIGSDGFGFAPQTDGTFKKIQQLGNVIIEDDVEIGSNCTIDRAALGSTIIHKGAKLDNLIQIAHNVEIGQNTVMAAQAGVAGSSKIGDNCMIGGQAGIVGHINVAEKTIIGAQAGIISSIKTNNQTLLGSPAIDIKQYYRSYAVFRNLRELQQKINELEKQMEDLKKTIVFE